MATDFGDGPSPEGQSGPDYSLSATGLVSRTISLWTKKLLPYIIMIGGILVMYTIVEVVVASFVLGELVGGLASTFSSFFTNLVYWFLYPAEVAAEFGLIMMVSTIFLFIGLIVTAVVVGATIKFTLDQYTEGNEDIGSSLSFSFGKFVPMFLVIVIINALFGLLIAPGAAISQRSLELVDITDPYSLVGMEEMLSGLMLTFGLSIPLLFLSVRLAPVFAVLIAEDVSFSEAFNRAFRLTSGNFMHVLAGWVLIYIVNFVIDFAINIFAFALLGVNPVSTIIYSMIALLITSPITYIFFTVLYKDLESRSGTSEAQQAYW